MVSGYEPGVSVEHRASKEPTELTYLNVRIIYGVKYYMYSAPWLFSTELGSEEPSLPLTLVLVVALLLVRDPSLSTAHLNYRLSYPGLLFLRCAKH